MDIDQDGFVTENELQRILACMRPFYDNEFEQNGANEAAILMKKLDTNKTGKVPKEVFVSSLINDPECAEFCKSFNLDEASVKPGNLYTDEPGKFLNI